MLLQRGAASSLFSGVGKGPTGVIKSILDTSRTDGKVREEIFVDIVEKISCTFSSLGSVQNSQIDGAIQVSTKCPSALLQNVEAPTADLGQCMQTPAKSCSLYRGWPVHGRSQL